MNVLVVEDIPDVATTFAALIRAYGHRTQVAYDGVSALQMVREFKPHTVFIDIGLPGMDGYELAMRLRRMPGLEESMFVSVSGQDIDQQKWDESSLNRHLQKPLSVEAVLTVLAPEHSGRPSC